jgi:hypothetical protein
MTVKCETPRYVIPGELVSVLDSLPVKCQKYFDDIADFFGEHYLMETHEKNYAVHSVVPMPYIQSTIDWLRKRTDDSDRIKQYTKVYNKMERVRHEGTK